MIDHMYPCVSHTAPMKEYTHIHVHTHGKHTHANKGTHTDSNTPAPDNVVSVVLYEYSRCRRVFCRLCVCCTYVGSGCARSGWMWIRTRDPWLFTFVDARHGTEAYDHIVVDQIFEWMGWVYLLGDGSSCIGWTRIRMMGKSEHLDLFVHPMQKDLQHVADARTSAKRDDDVRLCTRI